MTISTEPPPFSDSFFQDILADEEEFRYAVWREYDHEASFGCLKPVHSRSVIHDAYQCYQEDVKRLYGNMKNSPSPDQFKQAGFLAYWLRRHNPAYNFREVEGAPSTNQKQIQEFLMDYGHVYLAFALGYKACLKFTPLPASKAPPELDANYIKSICYLMKYKSISPHAMGMIYRSLFFV